MNQQLFPCQLTENHHGRFEYKANAFCQDPGDRPLAVTSQLQLLSTMLEGKVKV